MTQYKQFQPLWWLRGPHAQTIWPSSFKNKPPAHRTDRFELADGDFLDLAWHGNGPKIILILHGLEGSVGSHYVIDLMHHFDPSQYTLVLQHHRGCSGEMNRLDRAYHSGETGDLGEVVKYLQTQTKRPLFAAIGFSLGGNMLLKWLGEQSEKAPISRAIAVSVPFELAASGQRLSQGLSWIYQHHLLKRLKNSYQRKFNNRTIPEGISTNLDLHKIRNFYDFDDQITAPLHGFDGADDYYHRSSCRQYLPNIQTPCLIIHAKDDPFVPASSIPDPCELPSCIELAISQNGGHVGFISGRWRPRPWLPARIELFLNAG